MIWREWLIIFWPMLKLCFGTYLPVWLCEWRWQNSVQAHLLLVHPESSLPAVPHWKTSQIPQKFQIFLTNSISISYLFKCKNPKKFLQSICHKNLSGTFRNFWYQISIPFSYIPRRPKIIKKITNITFLTNLRTIFW